MSALGEYQPVLTFPDRVVWDEGSLLTLGGPEKKKIFGFRVVAVLDYK